MTKKIVRMSLSIIIVLIFILTSQLAPIGVFAEDDLDFYIIEEVVDLVNKSAQKQDWTNWKSKKICVMQLNGAQKSCPKSLTMYDQMEASDYYTG